MSDELNRQVTEDEKKLWSEVMRLYEQEPYDRVRSSHCAQHIGLHESRARQIAKTWANDGLVQEFDNGNMVSPTEYGKQFSFDE